MLGVEGTNNISYHADTGLYQIGKKINGKFVSMGYGKTLIEALVKRDWCIAHNWQPYPRTTRTNEKYIRLVDNHYKVMKRIRGKYKTYGSFNTLEEAVTYRDFIVSKGWSTNYKYKNPMRNIYRTSRGNRWYISKKINGELINFGSFIDLNECKKERDLLEKYNYNLDLLMEHDEGDYSYLEGKQSTRILFKKYESRRDWY